MIKKGIAGDAHFFEETLSMDQIQRLLDNKSGSAGIAEKLQGMKSLLALISKGEDISRVFPYVVKNVIVSSVEVKKLVYMYLVHYADANEACRELALLSINNFQKDLADENPLIRALSLRVMTSIRVVDILQIQLIALRKCATDVSPYVRKCAAYAIPKLYALEASEEQCLVLAEIVAQLLMDHSTMVLGSALQAFTDVCPHRLDLLHPIFRKICHLLTDMDEWGQIATLHVMMRYVRSQFVSPTNDDDVKDVNVYDNGIGGKPKEKKKVVAFPTRKKNKGFYSSSEDDGDSNEDISDEETSGLQPSPFHLGHNTQQVMRGSVFSSATMASGNTGGQELDEDHRLLLRSSLPLLKSRNSAVVLSVATLHYYCGSANAATSTLIGKSLVRIMRNQREITYVVLSVIASMATKSPSMFAPFLHEFFIRDADPNYTRTLKLEVLTALAVHETAVLAVLKEFTSYVGHSDTSFVTSTVRCLGRIADANPSVADTCLRGLMNLVRTSSADTVVAESVVVIRQLLQSNPDHDCVPEILEQLAAMVLHSKSPEARASIIWIFGEFQNDSTAKEFLLDMLRLLVLEFAEEESVMVKMQILNLAVKVTLGPMASHPLSTPLLYHVLELCTFDLDYDLRDRARFISKLIGPEADMDLDPKLILGSVKPPPFLCGSLASQHEFAFGSLSNLIGHRVEGYSDLPQWASVPSVNTLRDATTNSSTPLTSRSEYSENDYKQQKESLNHHVVKKSSQGFYSENSDNEDNSDSDESSSEESSVDVDCEGESDSQDSSSEADSSSDSSEEEPEDKCPPSVKENNTNNVPVNASSIFDHFDLLNGSNDVSNHLSTLNITPPCPNTVFLSSANIVIEGKFSKMPSMYSSSMNVIELTIKNISASPLVKIRIQAKTLTDGQQLVPFPQVDTILPNATVQVQVHVDFVDACTPLQCLLKCNMDEIFDLDLMPTWSNLLVPYPCTPVAYTTALPTLEWRKATVPFTNELWSSLPLRMTRDFNLTFIDAYSYCGTLRHLEAPIFISISHLKKETVCVQIASSSSGLKFKNMIAPGLLDHLIVSVNG